MVELAFVLVLGEGVGLLLFWGFLRTTRRAPRAPLPTGPPTNTGSPADRAPVVVLAPFSRTTESLTRVQLQVVPSFARMTTSLPEIDAIVPRSNASVFGPALVWKVNWPSMPPSRRSRASASRTCRRWVAWPLAGAAGVFAGVRAGLST